MVRPDARAQDSGLMLSIDSAGCIRADQVVELDLGVRPALAGSSELLLHTAECSPAPSVAAPRSDPERVVQQRVVGPPHALVLAPDPLDVAGEEDMLQRAVTPAVVVGQRA